MNGIMKILCTAFIASIAIWSGSCAGNGGIKEVPGFNTLWRGISVTQIWPEANPDLLAMKFIVSVSRNNVDIWPDCVAKVEINPGDGTGWIDITDFWRDQLTGGHFFLDADRYEYTYTAPGRYSFDGRVTYTDGGVFTTGYYPDQVVVVPRGSAG
jgi:hypothetical protein